jgi:glycosyltransferase involved in cell wall biosynthesis
VNNTLPKKNKICIDISTILPGRGGSGGGIATYAINLVKHLDQIEDEGTELYCLKHSDLAGLDNLEKTKIINLRFNSSNIVQRLFMIHFYLPFFCKKNKIRLLHRIVPEVPLIKACKYSCTLHDLMFDFYMSRKEMGKYLEKRSFIKFKIFNRITKIALKISDMVITPSYAIKNEVVAKYNVPEQKIRVTHEASEISCIKKNKWSYTKDKKLRIGVVAGFYPHKGHFKVISLATQMLALQFSNFSIIFRGNPVFPSYWKKVEESIKENNLTEHIQFAAFHSQPTLADIYSAYDIVLLLSEYEGFGLPVIEAQAFGKPVFCSAIPVFREILNDSAYFLDSDINNNSVTDFINFLNNHAKIDELIEKGYSNLERFSWMKMSRQTLQAFTDTLNEKINQN